MNSTHSKSKKKRGILEVRNSFFIWHLIILMSNIIRSNQRFLSVSEMLDSRLDLEHFQEVIFPLKYLPFSKDMCLGDSRMKVASEPLLFSCICLIPSWTHIYFWSLQYLVSMDMFQLLNKNSSGSDTWRKVSWFGLYVLLASWVAWSHPYYITLDLVEPSSPPWH